VVGGKDPGHTWSILGILGRKGELKKGHSRGGTITRWKKAVSSIKICGRSSEKGTPN